MKTTTPTLLTRVLRRASLVLLALCALVSAPLASAQSAEFTKLADFNYSTTGYQAKGSLVQGSDGNFYGLTAEGGANGAGTVFKLTAGGVLTKLADFDYTNGYNPQGSLVQGSDGDFYGLTQYGGVNGAGVAFKVTAA